MQYVVVYERTTNGWSAFVPDLPGCVAAADTRAEVETLMREGIRLHIAELRKSGSPVPPPGSFTSLVEV
ncbi:MAG: type II toxin-antitoxin system HicB family antitoxin [Chloroflexi bacterium]|nr:type II toxin-antitoxin system HicB family antitoxin [Chloroflexota bacterium]